MIYGDPRVFAVESEVLKYYRDKSPKCLGFFLIHIDGLEYGIRELDATMLGNSYCEVARRLAQRGAHLDVFPNRSAMELALAINHFLYEREEASTYCGVDEDRFHHWIHNKEIVWAPDGDEGFDDGSHVLQFDQESSVRLIGFKRVGGAVETHSVRDVVIDQAEFYGTLSDWLNAFKSNWELAMSYENDLELGP